MHLEINPPDMASGTLTASIAIVVSDEGPGAPPNATRVPQTFVVVRPNAVSKFSANASVLSAVDANAATVPGMTAQQRATIAAVLPGLMQQIQTPGSTQSYTADF